jgi:thiol-disulfide isomerase/thioredoxin
MVADGLRLSKLSDINPRAIDLQPEPRLVSSPDMSGCRMKFLVLTLLLCAPGGPCVATAGTSEEVQIGQVLRQATLQGLNGPPRQLSAFRGRPLIINVWASWCGPCRAEMASLERLAWRDEGREFAIIGISTDDFADQAREWLQHSNATISQYIDQGLRMERMLGASTLPLTVLVDARGRVLDKIHGARDWDSLESLALVRKAFRTSFSVDHR